MEQFLKLNADLKIKCGLKMRPKNAGHFLDNRNVFQYSTKGLLMLAPER